MDKITEYKMSKTMDMPNLKEIAGQTVKIECVKLNEYTDKDGNEHKVMAVMLDTGAMYRTETRAFIDDMQNFVNAFDDPSERPAVTISLARSKRGNEFIKFTIA